ncbi:Thaumatin [Trema orientale]|uniref:Thaumatin n=1 Tax=Trema orientale TaxID=63057 RepID=A0A2P5EL34_TREOI|nr:Thaumatin [Trema orientale]
MAFWYFYLLALSFLVGSDASVFTLENRCKDTIWPGIQPGAGKPQLMDGGLQLRPGQAVKITAPKGWSGRFWGRRWCSFNNSGKGTCVTSDCGGMLKCVGAGGAPPATLAEFTLDSPVDFYDVSLVDGYNMPISIIPLGGSRSAGSNSCKIVRCVSDLNQRCPSGLQVRRNRRVVGCMSACMAFNKPEYCCTGKYGGPQTCKPTNYSKVFKAACPTTYSYAYDDPTSTFTCQGANYLIRFC